MFYKKCYVGNIGGGRKIILKLNEEGVALEQRDKNMCT
jgi:hypothetical protein